MNALRALVELCYRIPKAAYSLVEPKTFNALRSINRRCEFPFYLFIECVLTISKVYTYLPTKKHFGVREARKCVGRRYSKSRREVC